MDSCGVTICTSQMCNLVVAAIAGCSWVGSCQTRSTATAKPSSCEQPRLRVRATVTI